MFFFAKLLHAKVPSSRAVSQSLTKDFTIRRRDGNEKKQQLCTCISLFCTFLCRFCTTTTWNYLIFLFREDVNKQRHNFNLFLNLNMVLRNSTPEGFAYIWQSKWVGIIAIKTERTQIHFWSDVFAAVASSDRKVPIALAKKRTRWILREKAECKHLTAMQKQQFLKREHT